MQYKRTDATATAAPATPAKSTRAAPRAARDDIERKFRELACRLGYDRAHRIVESLLTLTIT